VIGHPEIGAVDRTLPGIYERLTQIAEDPTEEEACRKAAVRVG
jgi:hypothetical protein